MAEKKNLAQAITALQVYLDRGEEVLQYINKRKFAKALDTLKWRNAAFHNYRYYDQTEKFAPSDVYKELIEKIALVNKELDNSLEDVRDHLYSQLAKLQREKSRNRKYQSASGKGNTFTRTI